MMNKKLIKKFGFYKDCKRMEDYYLWISLISEGLKFENLPKVIVRTKINTEFLSRRSSFLLVVSEAKIQFLLLKKFKLYLFLVLAIFPLKIFYHLIPYKLKFHLRNIINYF